jgi:hypothetical protein
MARTSLAERMTKLEQRKARIAEEEAKIRTDERKQRTRRLIEAGGLVDKAGLLDLEANTLYGALLSLSAGAKDAARVAEWAKAGGYVFDREAKTREAGREPVILTFSTALPTAFSTQLRAAGLRWSKVLHHWEGLAEYAIVTKLAAEHDGKIHRPRSPGDREKRPAAE